MHDILLNIFAKSADLRYYELGRFMKELNSELILKQMRPGRVYRRSELAEHSSSVDRELGHLEEEGKVKWLGKGLYTRPMESAFGSLPPDDNKLIKSFLKDDRFLVFSFNDYNKLGLGLTQLYNQQVVYNYKRHEDLELGGRKFSFKRLSRFPGELSKEYLLIDLLNNLKYVAEDPGLILKKLKKKSDQFDKDTLFNLAEKYARAKTKKILKEVYLK